MSVRALSLAVPLILAGCVGWQGETGKSAISPPGLVLHDAPPPPPRALLAGTLWPPPDQPTFVVGDQRIVVERAGEPVTEIRTDGRGRFEVRLAMTGVYALSFSANGHQATAQKA